MNRVIYQAATAFHPPAPHIAIRPVQHVDISALRNTCWQNRTETRSRNAIQRVLKAQRSHRGMGIVVEKPRHDDIIAYGQILRWRDGAEISDLYVVSSARGRGIGTAMIQHLVAHALTMDIPYVDIGAAHSNPRALALYRRLGFRDSYQANINVGNGREPVTYLSLPLR